MSRANLPVVFGLVLAGGVLIVKGAGGFSQAFASAKAAVQTPESLGQADGPTPTNTVAPITGATGVRAAWQAMTELAGAAPEYVWGGGHDDTNALVGADCSGAISYVLDRAGLLKGSLTSGGFMNWGDPGEGQRITVWANATHVLMSVVDDAGITHWFGTSGFGHPDAPNGTGANWFTVTPSASYLADFTPRHPTGL